MPEARHQYHANPRIVKLNREIARQIGMRDLARKRGHTKVMRAHDAKIIELRAELNALTRKHAQVARSAPQRRASTTNNQIPEKYRDAHGTKPITPENAEQLIKHYRALLILLTSGTPFPLIAATRKAYTARLNEALRISRSVNRHGGKAMFHKARAHRAELERLHREQAARAARLRAARRFAEADDADRQAKHYRDEAIKMSAAENTPGVAWEQQALSPYLADKAGALTQQTSDDDGASVEASARVDEDGASASLDVDLPWYRRYALPIGLAAAVGIGLALTRKGKGGAAMRSVFTMKAKPSGTLKVSRRVFRTGSRPSAGPAAK